MSANKKIKLSLYREKCKSLKIKDYGTKNIIADRLKKYYIDNGLGIFDPKSLAVDEEDAVNEEEDAVNEETTTESNVAASTSTGIETNSQIAHTLSPTQ